MRETINLVIIISIVMSSCASKSDSDKIKKTPIINSTTVRNEQLGFDTDGYYLPVDTIEYENIYVVSILIATSDEKDNMGNSKIKFVELEYHDKTTQKVETVRAKEFVDKNKSISVLFDTKMGKVILNGQFLGEHGPTNDNIEDNQEIMVMKGTFKINDTYEKKTMFSYFGGD